MMKEMTKKDFKRICVLIEGLLRVFQVFLWTGFLVFIYQILKQCAVPSDDFTRAELFGDLLKAGYAMVCGIAVNHGASAFRNMRKAESPFLWDVSDKIKAASHTLLIGGAICSLSKGVLAFFGIDFFLTGPDTIGVFIMGFLLTALVYVLEQGCRLQKESDETL